MKTIKTTDELIALIESTPGTLYVRYSRGPAADRTMGVSRNHQTGQREAGLSVENVTPDPVLLVNGDRAALLRRHAETSLVSYSYIPGNPYLLTGTEVARGSDNEPLVADWAPVAKIAPALLDEIKARVRRQDEQRERLATLKKHLWKYQGDDRVARETEIAELTAVLA